MSRSAPRQMEAVADLDEIRVRQLLGLMRGVASFEHFTQAVAFYGLGQHHGGTAILDHGLAIGVEHLHRVQTAAAQVPQVVVRHVFHQLQ